MKVKVLRPFYDELEKTRRAVGDEFECSTERFNEIKTALPEWVEGETVKAEKPAPKHSKSKTTFKRGK